MNSLTETSSPTSSSVSSPSSPPPSQSSTATLDLFGVPAISDALRFKAPVRRQPTESEFAYRCAAVAAPPPISLSGQCDLDDSRSSSGLERSDADTTLFNARTAKPLTPTSTRSTATASLSNTRFVRRYTVPLDNGEPPIQFGTHRISSFSAPHPTTHFQTDSKELAHVVARLLASLAELHCTTDVNEALGEIRLSTVRFFCRIAATVRVFEHSKAGRQKFVVGYHRTSGDHVAASRLFFDLANSAKLCKPMVVPRMLQESTNHLDCQAAADCSVVVAKAPKPCEHSAATSATTVSSMRTASVWVNMACSDKDNEAVAGANALASESCGIVPCLVPAAYLSHLAQLISAFETRVKRALEAQAVTPAAERASFEHTNVFDTDRDISLSLASAIGDIAAAAAATCRLNHVDALSIANTVVPLLRQCLEDPAFDVNGKRYYLKTLAQLSGAHDTLLEWATKPSTNGELPLLDVLRNYELPAGVSSEAAALARVDIEALLQVTQQTLPK